MQRVLLTLCALSLVACETTNYVVIPEKQYKTAQQQQAAAQTNKQLSTDTEWQRLMNGIKTGQ